MPRKPDTFAIHAALGALLFLLLAGMAVVCSGEVKAAPPVIEQRSALIEATPVGPRSDINRTEANLTDYGPEPDHSWAPAGSEPPAKWERVQVYEAVQRCHRVSMRNADLWAVLAILRASAVLGMPLHLATAAACSESALGDPEAIGDGGKAVGAFQIHPLLARWCWGPNDHRHDPGASLRCLWRRTLLVAAKVRRRCGERAKWPLLTGWTLVSGGWKRYGFGCNVKGKHVKEAGL